MNFRNLFILMVLIVGFVESDAQNDPLYNQYQFNQLLINPAYAGVNDRMTATWLTRVQWMGINGAPVSNSASVHTTINATNMGLGLMVLNDRLGINNNNEVNAMYSYRLNFRNSKLQFGLQGGVINFNYDYSRLTLEYLDDPNLQASQTKFTKPNIGTGLFYYSDKFFIGISIPRLIDVKVHDGLVGSVRYRRSEYISAGYLIRVSDQLKLKPSVLLKASEGAPFSFDLNMNALFAEVVWVGLTLRNQNALGMNTQVQINDRIRFGYTFEYPFKPINFGNYGTHELMVSFDFTPFNNQIATRRYF